MTRTLRPGPCHDGGGELLGFDLQPANFFERAFGEDGEFSRLSWKQFTPERAQRLVHLFQLLERLSQDGFRCFHNRNCTSPLRASGDSRTRLKNSTYILYSVLSRSATMTSNP